MDSNLPAKCLRVLWWKHMNPALRTCAPIRLGACETFMDNAVIGCVVDAALIFWPLPPYRPAGGGEEGGGQQAQEPAPQASAFLG